MTDELLAKLVDRVLDFALEIGPTDCLYIEAKDIAPEATAAFVEGAKKRGATAIADNESSLSNSEIARRLTKEQAEIMASRKLKKAQASTVVLVLDGTPVALESDLPSDKLSLLLKVRAPFSSFVSKNRKWTRLRWPNPSMAQQANQEWDAFVDSWAQACLFDWSSVASETERLRQIIEDANQVRIVGENTDLAFSIAGIPACLCCGRENIPGGEVFTAPVKKSVNGEVFFNVPSSHASTIFGRVSLCFKDGKVVSSQAETNDNKLKRLLATDKGASFLGEFALGLNPKITAPLFDTHFDEKIAGSFHLALGRAYDCADNGNRSQLHWDLVSIQRRDFPGTIYLDNQVLRKDGLFADDTFRVLNASSA